VTRRCRARAEGVEEKRSLLGDKHRVEGILATERSASRQRRGREQRATQRVSRVLEEVDVYCEVAVVNK